MPLSEFAIIKQYFQRDFKGDSVILGPGDDCALVKTPFKEGQCQALSMDTLVAGVHFPVDTNPADVGYKSLAVNLSDLAAMGAKPIWFSLALTLPDVDADWLALFSSGLYSLAEQYELPLIGGDITKGPLSITIQIAGVVESSLALRRDGAKEGDKIFVSGALGDAAVGLTLLNGSAPEFSAPSYRHRDNLKYLKARLDRPSPRVSLGLELINVASSCIDVSDGLLADLSHLCGRGSLSDRSSLGCKGSLGTEIYFEQLPLSAELRAYFEDSQLSELEKAKLVLASGDDYELCFSAPEERREEVAAAASKAGVPVTLIGKFTEAGSIRCIDANGEMLDLQHLGFRHF
ncbi:MAG: thiamine-phosphate kinase [Pseudomonadales bacterium]|nr:thiamine-phosphate kinase [Pseudomonadales bacterium]